MLNKANFFLSSESFPTFKRDLLGGWKLATNAKFQLNTSKITPVRAKKHRDMGCEYHHSWLILIILVSETNTRAGLQSIHSICDG